MQINNNLLIWSDHKRNRSGHNVRALISLELSPAFFQRIFSSFCKTAGSSSLLGSLAYKSYKKGSEAGHSLTDLKNAKDLLEAGAINQKEFDAIKAKALG